GAIGAALAGPPAGTLTRGAGFPLEQGAPNPAGGAAPPPVAGGLPRAGPPTRPPAQTRPGGPPAAPPGRHPGDPPPGAAPARAGPSTGMPTKTEQADLLMALHGRSSDSPMPVLAPATPGECFSVMLDAFRIAVKYMTPVVVLSDGYLANSAEPWRIPDPDQLPRTPVVHPTEREGFAPYLRDTDTLARPWAIPGTPGLEHRIGGLEKQDGTGNV